MVIQFSCPHCEAPLKARDELAGKIGKCPECGKAVAVPQKKAEEETKQESTS